MNPHPTTPQNTWHTDFDSSQITGYGYDAERNVLTIEFKSTGTTYDYFDVPTIIYEDLKAAESKGSYFIRNVKRGPFKYQKR